MTATPKNYDGCDDQIILSMNNNEWYGKKIYSYNTGDGIRDKYLCDYQIMTYNMNCDYVKDFIKDNKYVYNDVLETNESHYVACAIMILKAFKENICNHLVTFHNSIMKSKKFKNILESLVGYFELDIKLYQIDGSTNMNNRGKIIREYQNNEKCILTSTRVMNEGINLPIIESICFIDPKTSTTDIVQCVGRCIRLHENKTMAKILVPVMINDKDSNDSDNYVYGNMIRILKSLSLSDNSICEYFSCKNTGNKYNKKLVVYHDVINVEKIAENIALNEWFDNMELDIWKKIDGWNYMYEQLKKWNKDGKLPSQTSTDKNERQLAIWCINQKINKKKSLLNVSKINKLHKINNWKWNKTIQNDNVIGDIVDDDVIGDIVDDVNVNVNDDDDDDVVVEDIDDDVVIDDVDNVDNVVEDIDDDIVIDDVDNVVIIDTVDEVAPVNNNIIDLSNHSRRLVCDICPFTTCNNRLFDNHVKSIKHLSHFKQNTTVSERKIDKKNNSHINNNVTENTGANSKYFQCDLCGYKSDKNWDINRHLKSTKHITNIRNPKLNHVKNELNPKQNIGDVYKIIEDKNKSLIDKDKILEYKDKSIKEKDKIIKENRKRFKEKDKIIEEKDEMIEEYLNKIKLLEQQLASNSKQLNNSNPS